MADPDKQTEFVLNITRFQGRLYAYILSLLCDPELAADVLQETNLVLWSKAGQFRPGSDFASWAHSIAHYQVLAQRKRTRRDRLIFDDEAIAALSQRASELEGNFEDRQTALQHCLKTIHERHAALISRYYDLDQPLKAIAESLGQSPGAVSQALFRARMALLRCIQKRLDRDD